MTEHVPPSAKEAEHRFLGGGAELRKVGASMSNLDYANYLLDREARDDADRNGHTPKLLTPEETIEFNKDPTNPKWYETPRQTREREAREREEKRRGIVKRVSLAELIAAHPELHPPVVEGLVREGETANVIADPKRGKSWMVYGLALSIITGKPWLDKFKTRAGKVCLIDNELDGTVIGHRVPVVAEAMGIDRKQIDLDFEVISLRGRLRSLEELGEEIDKIEPGEFKAIFLDARYRFCIGERADENSNAYQTSFYNLVDQYAAETRAAFFLVHHATKGNQESKSVTDMGAGGGAQSRAADCHIAIRELEEPGCCALEAVVRSFPPVQPMAIRWAFPIWTPAIDVDPTKLKGRGTKQQEQQSAKDREGCEKILKALRDLKRGTARAMREKTGISRERQQRLLDWLMSEGHIGADTITIKGKECREYFIQESEEE